DGDARRRLPTRATDVRRVLQPRTVGAQGRDEAVRVEKTAGIHVRAVNRIECDDKGLGTVWKSRIRPGLPVVMEETTLRTAEEQRRRIGRRDGERLDEHREVEHRRP